MNLQDEWAIIKNLVCGAFDLRNQHNKTAKHPQRPFFLTCGTFGLME